MSTELSSADAMSYPYSRYLAAKRTVDDRALNRPVLDELRRLLPPGPPRVLEIGAGLGSLKSVTIGGSAAPRAPDRARAARPAAAAGGG